MQEKFNFLRNFLQLFGDESPQVAIPNLFYGKTLIELALKGENKVLALPDEEEDDEEEGNDAEAPGPSNGDGKDADDDIDVDEDEEVESGECILQTARRKIEKSCECV